MVREHNVLAWPAIRAELESSAANLWHALAWTGNLRAANALIGRKTGEEDYYDPDHAPVIDIEPLEITAVAARMFNEAFLPTEMTTRIPRRDALERELEFLQVKTWIEMQPQTALLRFTEDDLDESSLVKNPTKLKNLKRLVAAAGARNTLHDLADWMQGLEPDSPEGGLPEGIYRLTVAGIAALAHVDERSVRNAVGRSPGQQLTSIPRAMANRERLPADDYTIEVDAYQTMGWLAGRRYYRSARLDPQNYARALGRGRPDQVGRILGLLVWSNFGSTGQAREALKWRGNELHGWLKYGPTSERKKQIQLANLIGMDHAVLENTRTRRT